MCKRKNLVGNRCFVIIKILWALRVRLARLIYQDMTAATFYLFSVYLFPFSLIACDIVLSIMRLNFKTENKHKPAAIALILCQCFMKYCENIVNSCSIVFWHLEEIEREKKVHAYSTTNKIRSTKKWRSFLLQIEGTATKLSIPYSIPFDFNDKFEKCALILPKGSSLNYLHSNITLPFSFTFKNICIVNSGRIANISHARWFRTAALI